MTEKADVVSCLSSPGLLEEWEKDEPSSVGEDTELMVNREDRWGQELKGGPEVALMSWNTDLFL